MIALDGRDRARLHLDKSENSDSVTSTSGCRGKVVGVWGKRRSAKDRATYLTASRDGDQALYLKPCAAEKGSTLAPAFQQVPSGKNGYMQRRCVKPSTPSRLIDTPSKRGPRASASPVDKQGCEGTLGRIQMLTAGSPVTRSACNITLVPMTVEPARHWLKRIDPQRSYFPVRCLRQLAPFRLGQD